MKNRIIKITGILLIIIAIIFSSSAISKGGVTYNGKRYDTIKSLADLARNNNDEFRAIPASSIVNSWFDFGSLSGYETNVVCVEHYNRSDSGSYGRIWRVIDINPDGVNTLRVNGNPQSVSDYTTKQYLNAIAEAASKCQMDGFGYDTWGVSRTKAAYASLANGWQLSKYFQLNGSNSAEAYIYDSKVQNYINKYLENAKGPASTVETDIQALKVEDTQTNAVSDGTIIGPFKYKSANGQNISFRKINVIGKDDNNKVLYEKTIDNPSKDNLFIDAAGTKSIANGSIKSEQEFYIKTDKAIDDSAKISVQINVNGSAYYQTRILIFRQGDQQTFSAYSVGNGKTTKSSKNLEYEFDNNRGNIEIHKSGIYNALPVNKVENMGYKVFYKENNKNLYLIIENDRITGTTENSNDATIIYTDKNGDAYVRRVDSRFKYYLEEVTDKSEYSSNMLKATQILDESGAKESDVAIVQKGIIGPINVKRQQESKQTTVKINNTRKTGTLKILKQDYDKNNINISGVKFKVQNKETKQWVKAEGKDGVYNLKTFEDSFSNNKEYYKDNYTSDESQATEFETNKDGQITIKGVDIGEYIIKEVYIFNDNGNINYGYTEVDQPSNIDKNYVFWSTDGGKTKRDLAKEDIKLTVEDSNKTAESIITVYNKKKYLKIRGYVWEDMLGGKSNSYSTYGENTYAQGDTLVEGLNVRLKDNNGNVINTTKTDKNGAYEFAEVSREAIEKGLYYVEFEYNGLTYTSVVALVGNDSSVNSKEKLLSKERN